ncbi:hypothetical protein QBC46DRAFT_338804 [Diplogelasinospora grovesii]|uniref:Uncharacterized protein n=1 Tax=Diplogelasinospora grovesii TaxID=303347 RepID=A0AAN6S6M7_9PEZI|nr:hypothetical protein QBC46DRAFT_338804 [Diplogelasinospora grovesii]
MANQMLKQIHSLFDAELSKGIVMTATYRSGINIKPLKLGTIMFDFPSFRPTIGDHKRFSEDFYRNLANTLVDEFSCRPHWTNNSRDVISRSIKNLDSDHLRRFKDFDPNGIYKTM